MQKVEGSSLPFIRSGLLESGQGVSIGYDRQGALDAGLSEGQM